MRELEYALQQASIQKSAEEHDKQRRRQLQIEEQMAIGLALAGESDEPWPATSQAKTVKVQKKPSTKTSQTSSQKTSQKKPTSVPKKPFQKTSQKKATTVPKQPLQKTSQKKSTSVLKQLFQKERTLQKARRIQSKARDFRVIPCLAAKFKKQFLSMK